MSERIQIQPGEPFQNLSVTLDDRVFYFNVSWNSRERAWYFDIESQDNFPIVSGVKIATGMILHHYSEEFPDGVFLCSGESRPTLDSMGRSSDLYFYLWEELDA